jgi:hypothetical protein
MIDAGEDTGLGRRYLQIDLVGFELDQRVAGGNRIARLLQPLRHTRVDDGLADFRNEDVDRHKNR